MQIFVTGGTGYIGSRLIPVLIARGHRVAALVRPASERRVTVGCHVVVGDALVADSYAHQLDGTDTLVHLVGVAHPSPAKAAAFRTIDLASVRAALAAAQLASIRHLLYLSVAQPAPVMGAYVAVRAEAENLIRRSGIAASLLRPWYVVGPDHYWPLALLPAYYLAERLARTRPAAQRFGLIGIEQMVRAIVRAVEDPPTGVRVWEVPELRAMGG